MDLLDFVRGVHSWPKLYRLLSRLPEGSHLRADQLLDEKLAKHLLKEDLRREHLLRSAGKLDNSETEDPLAVRTSAGHTTEISLMMTLCELIQQLNSTLIAVNLPKGKRPPRVRPMPRPVSAYEVLRRRHEAEQVDSVVGQLLGGGLEIFDDSEG